MIEVEDARAAIAEYDRIRERHKNLDRRSGILSLAALLAMLVGKFLSPEYNVEVSIAGFFFICGVMSLFLWESW